MITLCASRGWISARRKDEGDAFSTIADAIWRRFASLAKMIDKGDPSVGLPPYNGGLFSAEATRCAGQHFRFGG